MRSREEQSSTPTSAQLQQKEQAKCPNGQENEGVERQRLSRMTVSSPGKKVVGQVSNYRVAGGRNKEL